VVHVNHQRRTRGEIALKNQKRRKVRRLRRLIRKRGGNPENRRRERKVRNQERTEIRRIVKNQRRVNQIKLK